MGIFDKVKNLFTEEVDEEPIKKEIRHVEQPVKPSIEKMEKPVNNNEESSEKEEVKPTREDKFVYFTDDDFKDLEKPKIEEPKKINKKEEKPLAYKGAVINPQIETKKEFKPSPIISPVYGVLDKNYQKDETPTKKVAPTIFRSTAVTIDDVRNKAFGTVEDDIKDDILGRTLIEQVNEEVIEPDINIFEELDKYQEIEDKTIEEETLVPRDTTNVDEIFGRLDDKKDEILDELDEKKDEILDEIDNKTNSLDLLSRDIDDLTDIDDYEELDSDEVDIDISDEETSAADVELAKNLLEDDETLELAKELEEQKKKLDTINDMMNENEKATKTKSKKKKEIIEEKDDLEESELFDLIDSTYEKKDDE